MSENPDDYDRASMAAHDYDLARLAHVRAAVAGPLYRLDADVTNDHGRAAEILTRALNAERAEADALLDIER